MCIRDRLITLLYFFAIYPILLVYSVAITNTVETFMAHQLRLSLIDICDRKRDVCGRMSSR